MDLDEESIVLDFDIEKNYLTGKYIYSKNGSGSIHGNILMKISKLKTWTYAL